MFRSDTKRRASSNTHSGQNGNPCKGALNAQRPRTAVANKKQVMQTPFPLKKPAQLRVELTQKSATNLYGGFNSRASGLFVVTWDILPLGTLVQIQLRLAGSPKAFPIFGRVAFIKEENELSLDLPPGMGIEFVHVHESFANQLANFANEREPIFFD